MVPGRGVRRGRLQPLVHVCLTNASSKYIDVVTIRGTHAAALVEGMPPQAIRDADVYCSGEDSLTLEIRFQDGEVLKEMARYVESGYSVTVTIERTKIAVATAP